MTHEEKIAAIRAACIAANPEIDKATTPCPKCDTNGTFPIGSDFSCPDCANGWIGGRSIRLADVLLAIPLAYLMRGDNAQAFIKIRDVAYRPNDGATEWNLRNDDLAAQSPECIDFLFELLPNPQP